MDQWFLLALCVLFPFASGAPYIPGVMQEGDNTKVSCPYIISRHFKYEWALIQPQPGQFNFTQFDSDLNASAAQNLTFAFTVMTGQAAPEWLYDHGVPKVIVNFTGQGLVVFPYYLSPQYEELFKAMISTVYDHVNRLSDTLKSALGSLDVVLGSTGDVTPWHGPAQDPKYEIPRDVWLEFWKNYTLFYVKQYQPLAVATEMFILVVHGLEDIPGLVDQLAEIVPFDHLGNAAHEVCKQYQETGERLALMPNDTMYRLLHTPHGGKYMKSVCFQDKHLMEGSMNPLATAWSTIAWSLTWNLHRMRIRDWEIEPYQLQSWPMLKFFNKYAGIRSPKESPGVWAYLHDGLDAADTVRFPEKEFGEAKLQNADRMASIAQAYAWAGAGLDDPKAATEHTQSGRKRSGWNDVGWEILPFNYNMYLYQIEPATTTDGRWRVGDANNTKGENYWGRFSRAFNHSTGKNTMSFRIDSGMEFVFKSKPAYVRVVYFDDTSTGTFSIHAGQGADGEMPSVQQRGECVTVGTVQKQGTGLWTTAMFNMTSFNVNGACAGNSDIILTNDDRVDDIIAFLEVSVQPY